MSINNISKKRFRLDYVDIFRGIALLIMVSIQIFDYLSVSSIYNTPPYYVKAINSVTWVPPSLLFTFVVGMSVFLMINNKLKFNLKKSQIVLDVIKRYGKYVLISLPFTLVMWNLKTYIGWEEAIQGLGLCAVFLGIFLLSFKKIPIKYLILIIIIFTYLQSFLPNYVNNLAIFAKYPRYPDLNGNGLTILISVILNALIRGWFSIVNLFPIMLGGLIFIRLALKNKNISHLFLFSLSFLILSIVLDLIGLPIDYYGRSFSLTFFAIGESALICTLFYYLYKKKKGLIIFKPLKVFGLAAFTIYIGHYLLILKVLELLKLKDLLPDLIAGLITLPLVIIVYFVAKAYLERKQNLFKN